MAIKRNQTQLGMYVSPETAAKLRTLSAKTRIPQAALFREALADLFKKHASILDEGKPTKTKK